MKMESACWAFFFLASAFSSYAVQRDGGLLLSAAEGCFTYTHRISYDPAENSLEKCLFL